jgi:hypothetical protein
MQTVNNSVSNVSPVVDRSFDIDDNILVILMLTPHKAETRDSSVLDYEKNEDESSKNTKVIVTHCRNEREKAQVTALEAWVRNQYKALCTNSPMGMLIQSKNKGKLLDLDKKVRERVERENSEMKVCSLYYNMVPVKLVSEGQSLQQEMKRTLTLFMDEVRDSLTSCDIEKIKRALKKGKEIEGLFSSSEDKEFIKGFKNAAEVGILEAQEALQKHGNNVDLAKASIEAESLGLKSMRTVFRL